MFPLLYYGLLSIYLILESADYEFLKILLGPLFWLSSCSIVANLSSAIFNKASAPFAKAGCSLWSPKKFFLCKGGLGRQLYELLFWFPFLFGNLIFLIGITFFVESLDKLLSLRSDWFYGWKLNPVMLNLSLPLMTLILPLLGERLLEGLIFFLILIL